ncbi:MAG TPA: ATP-dependent DNA ligase [Nitrospira sp.]|nr:ATP-dependent DNA ligase [Nitrospira sp.]HND02305.1 ATP-dependent DNA ligase [Nitrospira sp.]
MQAFAILFEQLDQTTATNEKVRIMTEFFRHQDPDTSAWVLFFLSGQRPKQIVGSTKLRRWAQEKVGYPDWLMEESYAAVGDTAELIALVLAAGEGAVKHAPLSRLSLGEWMVQRILPLAGMDDQARRSNILAWWEELETNETFILNKLLTGSLRVGVSETLVYRAVAAAFSLSPAVIASRLVGTWQPSAEFFLRLSAPAEETQTGQRSDETLLPLPFCLAAPMEGDPEELGDISNWQCEWKWDGIRCQVVKSGSRLEIWSRGEERITGSFPDLSRLLSPVSGDWVIDGEIVAGDWHRPDAFQSLQRRLNRKKPSLALIASSPVSFLAYDLLQADGRSWRHHPLAERQAMLERTLHPYIGERLGISPLLALSSWEQARLLRETSRVEGAEGLMLKAKDSEYVTGRKRGVWFKWKIDPLAIDAVLTAAQPGTGRRASLYTDYTFAVWAGESLITVAKAYSGLTDEEIRELDGWIRKHTRERFGPVRMVEARRVFEIGFEGISQSDRHKSGFALRFPRILRERTDKRVEDADHVATLETLLASFGSSAGRLGRARARAESLPGQEQLQFELGAGDVGS